MLVLYLLLGDESLQEGGEHHAGLHKKRWHACAVRVPASTAKRGPNPNPNPNQLGDERLQEGGEHCGGRHLARVEVGLDEGVLRHEEEEERSGSGGWAGGHHVRGHDHRPRQNGAPSLPASCRGAGESPDETWRSESFWRG